MVSILPIISMFTEKSQNFPLNGSVDLILKWGGGRSTRTKVAELRTLFPASPAPAYSKASWVWAHFCSPPAP